MMTWQCQLCESGAHGTAVKRSNGQSDLCTWCRAELRRTGRGYCPRCKVAYPLVEMRDGYCVAHKREINAAYRAAHVEQERARVRAWRETTSYTARPHTQEERRKWHAAHRDANNARSRAWHHAHRERARERMRAYTQANAATNPDYWRARYRREKVCQWQKGRRS